LRKKAEEGKIQIIKSPFVCRSTAIHRDKRIIRPDDFAAIFDRDTNMTYLCQVLLTLVLYIIRRKNGNTAVMGLIVKLASKAER
jgi:hypothetical protein